jgi:hypothetical protein
VKRCREHNIPGFCPHHEFYLIDPDGHLEPIEEEVVVEESENGPRYVIQRGRKPLDRATVKSVE